MFTHQGKSRTLLHNLRIATFLSLVAGIVNVVGFLAIRQLTTNVTGHFALFMLDFSITDFWQHAIYLFYIFWFLMGAFTSSFLIEQYKSTKRLNVYVLPIMIESIILSSVAISSNFNVHINPNLIACSLLFAMGLQNSYVTRISNAVVRTTHLTGLFTDLGIELSQLLFPKAHPKRDKIKARVKLRIYIIAFFFLGGLIGGFFYSQLGFKLNTLFIAVFILLVSVIYDDLRYNMIMTKRRFLQQRKRGKD